MGQNSTGSRADSGWQVIWFYTFEGDRTLYWPGVGGRRVTQRLIHWWFTTLGRPDILSISHALTNVMIFIFKVSNLIIHWSFKEL